MNSGVRDKPAKKSRIWQWLPGFILSFIAIFALVKIVPIDQAIGQLKNTPFSYYLLMAFFLVLFLIVRTVGWWALLSFQPGFKDTFMKISLGYFINNIFPLRLGEISRAVFMGASLNVNPVKILPSIVLERVFDLLILAVLLLIMVPYVVGLAWLKTTAWIILGCMAVTLVVLFLIIFNSNFIDHFLLKLKAKNYRLLNLLISLIQAIVDGFKTLRSPKYLLIGFIGILGSWMISFIQFSLLLNLMTGNSEWWWGIFANTALALGIALPSAPAGLGLYESAIVAGLKFFNISESLALVYALIMHITQFIVVGVLGLIAFIKSGQSIESLFNKLTKYKDQMKQPQVEFKNDN